MDHDPRLGPSWRTTDRSWREANDRWREDYDTAPVNATGSRTPLAEKGCTGCRGL